MESILDKRAAGIVGYHVFLYKGNVGLQLADSGGYRNFGSSAFVADSHWHHFAVTVDRTQHAGVLLYLDGVLTSPTGDPTSRPGSLSNTVPLTLGNRSAGLSDAFFLGQLDEVELFNRVLGPAEVAAIAGAGSTGKCKCAALKVAPRAWWRFDEPAGATAIDSGGDAQGPFDGNVAGAVRNPHGQVAGDLVFNGTSDAVDARTPAAGAHLLPGATGAVSIDTWIKRPPLPVPSSPTCRSILSTAAGTATPSPNSTASSTSPCRRSTPASSSPSCTSRARSARRSTTANGIWQRQRLLWGPGGNAAIATLFVDGMPVATSLPVALSGTAGGSLFQIGAQATTSRLPNATFFGGEIDEVEIFDRALTQADFLTIFAAGPAGKCKHCDVLPRPVASCGTTGALPCPGGEFCDFFTNCGANNGGSLCAIRPHVCSPVSAPVCGCDQTTYNNA